MNLRNYLIAAVIVLLCGRNFSSSANELGVTEVLSIDSIEPGLMNVLEHAASWNYFKIPDSLHRLISRPYTDTNTLKGSNKIILGWSPYWLEEADKYFVYDLLTHVVYFGMEVNSNDGSLSRRDEWSKSSLTQNAQNSNPDCKVFINVFSSGKDLKKILSNKSISNGLIENIISAIELKSAHGVCIDFERIEHGLENLLSAFIINLKEKLILKGYGLCMTLPSLLNASINVIQLNNYVDFFVLMAYDYRGGFNPKSPGPVAPLYEEKGFIENCIDRSVNLYLKSGMDTSKLCLGVPYFGAIWTTQSLQVPGIGLDFVGYRPYVKSDKLLKEFRFNQVSQTSYCTYRSDIVNNDTTYRQYWSEDVRSLEAKYDYVNRERLAGIGIWALGFDAGRTELWDLIHQKFYSEKINEAASSQADSLSTYGKPLIATEFTPFRSFVSDYPYTLGLCLCVLFTVLLIICLRLIFNINCRNELKKAGILYQIAIGAFILFFIVFSSIAYFVFSLHLQTALIISAGICGLILIIYILTHMKRKVQP